MGYRTLSVLAIVLLLAVSANALPSAPTGLAPNFHPSGGIFISWEHADVENVSFNVYRGESLETMEIIVNVIETSYLDSDLEREKAYFYAVTAVDETGESLPIGFEITLPKPDEKPFTIELVEPTKTNFDQGDEVQFVVKVNSTKFSELENLKASVASPKLGIEQEMAWDSQKNFFIATVKLPEERENFPAPYSINVTALFEGTEYKESLTGPIAILPIATLDTWQYAVNFAWLFGPWFLVIAGLAGALILWGSWSAKLKVAKDALRLELLEIQKERVVWKHEVFKRRITPEQFREKEGTLQGKQAAVEEKLGLKRKKGQPRRKNVFDGFSPIEAQEVVRLVKGVGRPHKGQTEDGLRARLVGLGRSEKIAKKVASIVFRK